MRKQFHLMSLALLAMLVATPAFALDLHSARQQNLVGEGRDGYAVALSGGNEVKALVNEVNAKRRAEYQRIAKGNGQPVDVVAALAASQIVSGLGAGESYQASDGSWKKR